MDQRILRRWDVTRRIFQLCGSNPQSKRGAIGGRTGDDDIVVIREFLRFLETLPATGGAAIPVRQARSVAVKSFYDGLRFQRHFVLGAPAEVDQFLGMAKSECAAAAHRSEEH